jgi:hypothetical protein
MIAGRPPNALFALILAGLIAIVGLQILARSRARAAVAGPCEAGGCTCRAIEERRRP